MTDSRVPADRVPEPFDDGSARSALARSTTTDGSRLSRSPQNPWLRGLFWMWVGGAVVTFILLVVSSTAGNSNTAYYPTWDLSSSKQTILVLLVIMCALVTTAALVAWLAVRAAQWRAPE